MYQARTATFTAAQRRAAEAALKPMGGPPRGLLAGTRIDTDQGWRLVETLVAGDLIHTRDGGLRPLKQIDRMFFAGSDGLAALRRVLMVPGGALGNCTPFFLLPDQHLMFVSAYAEAALGTPFTLVAGRALAGHRGITPMRLDGPVEVITLRFAEEEVIWANTGVLMHCPSVDEPEGAFQSEFYATLDGEQAEALIGLLDMGAVAVAEAGAAVRNPAAA